MKLSVAMPLLPSTATFCALHPVHMLHTIDLSVLQPRCRVRDIYNLRPYLNAVQANVITT